MRDRLAACVDDTRQLAQKIQNVLVRPDATRGEIVAFCQRSRELGFHAVVVLPCWVSLAKELVSGSCTRVSAGIGFPMGGDAPLVKVVAIRDALAAGADEFDVMPNIGWLKSGDHERFRQEIALMVEAAEGRPVKVMLEFGCLSEEEKRVAARLAEEGGASWVKNSSGWGAGGPAREEDIRLLRATVSPRVGVKASGGIRTREDVLRFLAAGADLIGTSAGFAILGADPARPAAPAPAAWRQDGE